MHEIRFHPIRLDGSRVQIAWTVEPETRLYQQTEFTLDYGDALDPQQLPLKLWWTVVLLSLHSHWNLLRPCRVILPFAPPAAEIEFWSRLLDYERAALETYRGTDEFARTVELVGDGLLLDQGELAPSVERYATAFSGGRDSLAQAALLCEVSSNPLLVNTQSEMPPNVSHSSAKRARVLSAITQRRQCETVVVKSDYRSIWNNIFSRRMGYHHSVNEMTDVYFYCANLFALSAARGIRTLGIGCEFEMQNTWKPHAGMCANFYFDANPTVLGALSALLSQWQTELASLLFPLSSFEIEKVLWRRYRDLADLQNSCFSIKTPDQIACSECRKDFKASLALMALDIDPAELEIDITKLFLNPPTYPPRASPTAFAAVAYAAQQIVPSHAREFFPARTWAQRLGISKPPAYRAFENIARHLANYNFEWVGQYHPQFVKYIPKRLRAPLDAIYREYATETDPTDRTAEIAMIDAGISWICAPLSQESIVQPRAEPV